MKRLQRFACSLFCILAIAGAAHAGSVYPDGTLIKAIDGTNVYFIEDGTLRWIETESAFLTHQFNWNDIETVSPHTLDIFAEGPSIMESSTITQPSDDEHLPDILPLPVRDIHFSLVDGEQALRFTGSFWNAGTGELRLKRISDTTRTDNRYPVYQTIEHADGSSRERKAGEVYFHTSHDHFHLDDFGEYVLEPAGPMAKDGTTLIKNKVSFCLRDDQLINVAPSDAPQRAVFTSCDSQDQGVSVGWTDVYQYMLEDQFIHTDNVPAGLYKLLFRVDPTRMLEEATIRNNTSVALIDINPEHETVDVLATLTPHAPSENIIQDDLLIRGERSDRIYITHDNKKRPLSADAIASYGHVAQNAITLPEAVVASIPDTQFVKTNDGAIHMINTFGYIRRILNPDVLAGYPPSDIPNINNTELEDYRPTEYIKKDGSPEVYSIHKKTIVGLESHLSQLDIDQLAVHDVNEKDFRSYVVGTVVQNMTIPWDVAFLPDGDMLVTERAGVLHRFGSTPFHTPIPDVVHTGEGGLMGIAVHPNYTENHYIYLYFTTGSDGSSNRVVRYRVTDAGVEHDRVIVDDIPGAVYHDGGQIAFGPDGMLYITAGDAGRSEWAQDTTSLAGKTLRVSPDGNIPNDNPFNNLVWSYGHRNAQGIAWDQHGNMWQTEHGRSGALSGFDELNLVEAGGHYGWPLIQGGETQAGMRPPTLHSGPNDTWAPSGLAHKNDTLYFSGLRGSRLYAVTMQNREPVRVREYFTDEFGRLRAATIGPDGMLYVTTSNRDGRGSDYSGDDRVIKIAPDMLSSLLQ